MRVKTELKWDGDTIKLRGRKVVNKSAFEIGLIVEGNAKPLINNVSGRLAASITTQSNKEGSGSGIDTISKPSLEGVVLVGTPVEYAPYVEFGTSRADAFPFLRPALNQAKGRDLALLKKNGKTIFAGYIK